MNGIHDMGGMQGFGAIPVERREPVFHARWGGRHFALNWLVGDWSAGAARHERELIAPATYLRMSNYEKWLEGFVRQLVKTDVATQAELDDRVPPRKSLKDAHAVARGEVAAMVRAGSPSSRDVPAITRFISGQQVRARNMHPVGHTRLPRYARGRIGTVVRDNGVFAFPDTDAHGLGEKPQHVYSVRYSARELWGEQADTRDSVYVDMWNGYLEPA